MNRFILVIIILGLLGGIAFILRPEESKAPEPVMCTADAKECPDGSFVGRIPPQCQFAACPGEEVQQ